jgi:hypothetical protein
MSQSNVNLIENLYAAFARGDAPTVLAGMDPAIVWNEAEGNPYADLNPYTGPGAVAQGLFFRLATEWDAFQVHPATILDAGDTVVALGRYTGTYKATGTSMDAQFAHVFTLRDSKVIAFQQYTDTAQMVRAMQR